jgi:hypothetical protein
MIYNLHIRKLDSRTTNGSFIGYAINYKGFRFYYPSHSTRIVESINARLLVDFEQSGSVYSQKLN